MKNAFHLHVNENSNVRLSTWPRFENEGEDNSEKSDYFCFDSTTLSWEAFYDLLQELFWFGFMILNWKAPLSINKDTKVPWKLITTFLLQSEGKTTHRKQKLITPLFFNGKISRRADGQKVTRFNVVISNLFWVQYHLFKKSISTENYQSTKNDLSIIVASIEIHIKIRFKYSLLKTT